MGEKDGMRMVLGGLFVQRGIGCGDEGFITMTEKDSMRGWGFITMAERDMMME